MKLIRMEAIREIVQTFLLTPFIAHSIPLSVMLVARPGSGKSKLLLEHAGWPGIHRADDLTASGIVSDLEEDKEGQRQVFLLPEFNKVLGHRPQVVNLTMSTFLGMCSEGMMRIDDGREKKDIQHSPVGFATGVVPSLYERHAANWSKTGMQRRFMPVFYEHSEETKKAIQDAIEKREVSLEPSEPQPIPRHVKKLFAKMKVGQSFPKVDVSIPQDILKSIREKSELLAERLSWYPARVVTGIGGERRIRPEPRRGDIALPYTPHGFLQTLAAAHAWRDNRKRVTEADFKFIEKLITFARYGNSQQI